MTTPDTNNFEQRLIAALQQEASLAMTTTDTQRELDRWRDDQRHRKSRQRITVAVAAAVAAAAVILGIALGVAPSKDRPEPLNTPTPPIPSLPAAVTLSGLDQLDASVEVTKATGPVNVGSVAFGAVWATGLEETNGKLYRLDPAAGTVMSTYSFTPLTATISVPTRVGNSVLVAGRRDGQDGYVAFDRAGKPVGLIPATDPGVIAGDETGGWVKLDPSTIGRVDATGTRLVSRVQLPDADSYLLAMAVSGDALYVVTSIPHAVYRLDAQTGASTGTLQLDATPAGVVATAEAAYVATEDYQLLRVAGTAMAVTAVSQNDVKPGAFYVPFLGTDGSLWVEPNEGGVAELDPVTLEPLRTFQVLPDRQEAFNFGGAFTDGRAFVGGLTPGQVASIPLR